MKTHGLQVRLGGQPVLRGVDLSLRDGERVVLMGASGSGKTTLLRVIAGLILPQAGTVSLGRRLLSKGPRSLVPPPERGVAMVFQDLALWPHMTASRHLEFVLGSRDRERAAQALAQVGLAGREDAHPAQLSGGERQRLALARALVRRPELLLLDEPFASLDLPLKLKMTALLHERQRDQGFAVLHVTHDPLYALRSRARLVWMDQGRITHDGPARELLQGDTPVSAELAAHIRDALDAP